ncbi:PEP/pyruvate-binding domain-containing protein [Thalassotalea ganghwensis]
MKFASKAETLAQLSEQAISADVLPQYCFTVEQWRQNPDSVLTQFFSQCSWSASAVVVRSSGMAEDSDTESLAGHFDSIVNVQGKEDINDAIKRVVASFHADNPLDQVFIQPLLQEVKRSGVLFSCEPSTLSPYYVINYSTSGDTEDITSGATNDSLIYVAKAGVDKSRPAWVSQLVKLAFELENLFENNNLDIEFAFDSNEKLFLFQVRPLVVDVSDVTSNKDHKESLQRIRQAINRITKPHPYLNGKKSVLGVMPDWNPAEIIGIRPNPLALSLYKELVTNSTWAYQRNNYGYKQLRSFPLLISLAGLPYIDVRVSFNSFIPATVSESLAEKLVNYYIDQLESSPEKHDKVEFDIIFSCFTLDIEERLNQLLKRGFSGKEIDEFSTALKSLTNNIINPEGLWVKDIEKIESLPARREKILNSNLSKIEKIYWLLEDCKRYGTLPFAGLARAGFIAVQFLRSMVNVNILSESDYQRFMYSLETVSSSMAADRKQLSLSAFIKKYGHLRPGTYDILSPRYDQAPEKYFDFNSVDHIELGDETHQNEHDFVLSLKQLDTLKLTLEQHGIAHDVISLFKFIKGAIEGREYAKFIFTQSLSDAMLLMEQLGAELGISTHDMAMCDVNTFYSAYSSAENIKAVLQDSIQKGKNAYKEAQSIILPPLILNADCVYCFEMPENEPNFITMKQVIGDVTADVSKSSDLKGKIVFIPSADPGFDWLFSHSISGLVTKFGGANSHMAIRAGELGIPSVIGAGEVFYEKWRKAKSLEVDAANKRVVILK